MKIQGCKDAATGYFFQQVITSGKAANKKFATSRHHWGKNLKVSQNTLELQVLQLQRQRSSPTYTVRTNGKQSISLQEKSPP